MLQVRNKVWRAAIQYVERQSRSSKLKGPSFINRLRKRMHRLVTDEKSSREAVILAIVINACVISSTLSYIYTSLPDFRMREARNKWGVVPAGVFWNDAFCAVVFTVELGLRVLSVPELRLLLQQPTLLNDVLALVPWYTKTITGQTINVLSVLRVLRSVRILMFFRATKHLVALLGGTVKRAANMLLLLMCIITMWICLLGVALWTFERGDWDPLRRGFFRKVRVECPVACPQRAVFGVYAGCDDVGQMTMIDMGYSFTDPAHEGCVNIEVRPSRL